MRRLAGDGAAVETNLAAAWCVDAGNKVEQGGLAGAVGSDYRIDNAGIDAEADGLHRHYSAEGLAQFVDFEQGHPYLRANRAASVGTRPRGSTTMNSTRMTP